MPIQDLATLAELLGDPDDAEKIQSNIHGTIDRLIATRKHSTSWTESVIAITAICTVLLALLGAGLTGYLNLREPLQLLIRDFERSERIHKEMCQNINKNTIECERLNDLHVKDAIHLRFNLERINEKLERLENPTK